ncbi:MAG: hypothetical protein AABY88_05590 [Pseudomonadota bacterium]
MTKSKRARLGARRSSAPATAPQAAATAASAARPSRRRPKQNRWNDTLRAIFIEELYETCCVREALKKTGMSISGLYKHRATSAKFREMWDQALDAGYAMLESEMLDRARNGHIQEVVAKSGEIVRIKVISNQMGLALLKLHLERVVKIRAERDARPFVEDAEEVRREILARLERISAHNKRKADADEAKAQQAPAQQVNAEPCIRAFGR